jgi:hypothetical protein
VSVTALHFAAPPCSRASGIENMVLIRDVMPARRAAAAFSSDEALTIPRTFFWLGQITNQTLKAMINASQSHRPAVERSGPE